MQNCLVHDDNETDTGIQVTREENQDGIEDIAQAVA